MRKYCKKKKGNEIFMKVSKICEERHRDKEYGEHMILKRADKRVKKGSILGENECLIY